MRGAGHRVFGNAHLGREVTADEVDILARCGDGDGAQIEMAEQRVIRAQRADGRFAVEDGDIDIGNQNLCRRSAETGAQEFGHAAAGDRRIRREVHFDQRSVLAHEKVAALRLESNHRRRVAENVEEHVRRSQRRVPAQVDLLDRREPAQLEAPGRRHEECRLREIVLLGDRLQQPVVEPMLDRRNKRIQLRPPDR